MANTIPHNLSNHRIITIEIMPIMREQNDLFPGIERDEQGYSVCFVSGQGETYSCEYLPERLLIPVMLYHIQNSRHASILRVRTFHSVKHIVEPLKDNPHKEIQFQFLGG